MYDYDKPDTLHLILVEMMEERKTQDLAHKIPLSDEEIEWVVDIEQGHDEESEHLEKIKDDIEREIGISREGRKLPPAESEDSSRSI